MNVINQSLIFTWKLACLGISIITGYAAIAHFDEHPIFGIMYYVIFANVTVAYSLMYQKAFKIPALFKQIVNAELTKLGPGKDQAISRTAQKKVLVRQFRSFPSMAIKVGQFHSLERTSTPLFLDFVLRNILGMLVTFNQTNVSTGV